MARVPKPYHTSMLSSVLQEIRRRFASAYSSSKPTGFTQKMRLRFCCPVTYYNAAMRVFCITLDESVRNVGVQVSVHNGPYIYVHSGSSDYEYQVLLTWCIPATYILPPLGSDPLRERERNTVGRLERLQRRPTAFTGG